MASGSTLIHASEPARALANRVLSPVARGLVAAGVTANAVTAVALALSLAAALLLASGRFAAATPFIVFASIGDALDGVLARMSATASPGGALFDAAADRYQEMAILAGLAIHLREDVASLAIVLAALLASFMVSYGSAKAEALRVPVPPGSMRRLERSVCLCAGVALVPVARVRAARGIDDLEFGGWDIFPDDAYEAAEHADVLEKQHLDAVKDELSPSTR
jgi:CDP-diacylglycerol--glycerol-3-phosphate 3-phosphatidyltransferase